MRQSVGGTREERVKQSIQRITSEAEQRYLEQQRKSAEAGVRRNQIRQAEAERVSKLTPEEQEAELARRDQTVILGGQRPLLGSLRGARIATTAALVALSMSSLSSTSRTR